MFKNVLFLVFLCYVYSMKYLEFVKIFLLKILLTLFYLMINDLPILNAAITYYALLSFVPLVMILGLLMQKIFIYFPQTLIFFGNMLSSFNIELLKEIDHAKILKETNLAGFGIFGVITIFLTSTLFLRAINKIFKKIFRITEIKESIKHSLMPFLVYMLFLLVIIMTLLAKVLILFLENILVYYVEIDLSYSIYMLEKFSVFPVVLFVLILTVSYHFLSLAKIKWIESIKISLFFLITIFFVNIVFKHFYNVSFYNAIYGALSSLIITLAYVYTFFLVFLFWGQYGFVDRNYKGVLVRIVFDKLFSKPKSVLVRFMVKMLKNKILESKKISNNIFQYKDSYAMIMDGSIELVDHFGLSIYLNRFDFFRIADISEDVEIKPSESCLLLILDEYEKDFLERDSLVASGIFKSNEKVLIF